MIRHTRLLAGSAALALAGCQGNLAWQGPKTYTPPPVQSVYVDGFGIDAQVDVLPSGALPITVARTLTNTGPEPVLPGYIVRDTVEQLVFQAVGGAARWTRADPAQYTRFICEAPGPALAPGQTAQVTFTMPGPQCRQVNPPAPPPLPAFACGLYLETLEADAAGVIPETDETDNTGEHYFYVPSTTLDITMNSTPNAGAVNATVGADTATVMWNAPPGQVLWTVTVNTVPAGQPYTIDGRSPAVAIHSGDTLTIAPPTPLGTPAAPLTVPTTLTINATPNPAHTGPLTDILVDGHTDQVTTTINAFTADGCLFRQRVYRATFVHPN